jgi:hypothetical protein
MKLRYNSNETEPEIEMVREFFDKRFVEELLRENPDRL